MTEKKVLIVAQIPPPFHGQAIMQKYLVDVKWNWCNKEFVRMNFSDEIGEVGIFKIKKLCQLLGLIKQIRRKSKPKPDLVYYPPAGPNRIPIYRDVLILFFLKMVSKKVILHFHAGGIDQIFNKVTKLESYFIRKAFKKADGVIVLTEWLKKELEWCVPKKIFVVGNGIEDSFENFSLRLEQKEPNSFLFIGNLKEEKGIFTLLQAAVILKERGEKFKIRFIGSFHSTKEKQFFFHFISENSLNDYVIFLGPKNGNEKWKEFERADVLCLPTYETEAMPISILEAMMFQIPVITTKWRSIPDIIRHGENGLLFEPKNAVELSICMQRLMHSNGDRNEMGLQARKDYLQNFTVEKHLNEMEKVFRETLSN